LAQSGVSTFLVEADQADRRIPGSIDAVLGTVMYAQDAPGDGAAEPALSDVLDDLAEAALRTGGK